MDKSKNHIVPRIGLGTYNMNSQEAEDMTYAAIKYGYRHIDTASVYRNEDGVGKALKRIYEDTDIKYMICKKEPSFPNSFFEVTGLLPD